LLRKQQETLGGYFILPHPVELENVVLFTLIQPHGTHFLPTFATLLTQ